MCLSKIEKNRGITMIERKWEWISNRLKELNLDDLSKTAKKFDNFLKKSYKIENTNFWIEKYEKINDEYKKLTTGNEKINKINKISRRVAYCTACEIEPYCDVCKFHKEFGYCVDLYSDFSQFIQSLYGVI